MVNTEAINSQIEEKFGHCTEALATLLKSIEDMQTIAADWNPQSPEDTKQYQELGMNLDKRIIFILRQILIRYGNLLYL